LSPTQPHTQPDRAVGGANPHSVGQDPSSDSVNWAGLIETGAQFTGISGQWTVPQIKPSTINEYSATWLGIDGATNTSLIQTGTGQDSGGGTTSYFAWYEILPAPSIVIGGVTPGDQMQASVSENSPGQWTIIIDDVTSNQNFSRTLSYTGAGASAEWIEETPTDGSGNIVPLANFGTVHFNAVKFAATGSPTASYARMVDTAGNVIAYPGNFDAGTDSFPITFGPQSGVPPTTTPPPTTTTTTTTTAPPPVTCVPADQHPTAQPTAMVAQTTNGCPGYWVVNASGSVSAFGNAPNYGGLNGSVASPVIDIIATPDGKGYWLATANGTVRAFGDAGSLGDMSGHPLNGQIIAMTATPDGGGYWLVGSDGGIFTFGDAQFYGSTGGMHINQPVVGMAPTPDGRGYWLVATDGGIFSFGDAPFLGSMGAAPLNQPVVGITADPAGRGYRMVAADGGIFSFGAPFFGSLGGNPPSTPIIAMAPSVDGNGYYMLGSGGGIYSFGDAPFLGSAS
jgi:hypothetical protein